MIGHAHIEVLREQVARAQRELQGWEQLLAHAEQSERSRLVMPDPGMPAGQAWPLQPPAWQPSAAPANGRNPYETSIDGSELPHNQEAALGTITSEHEAYAQSRDGVKEEQKWSSA